MPRLLPSLASRGSCSCSRSRSVLRPSSSSSRPKRWLTRRGAPPRAAAAPRAVADDETRRAGLARRFVSWALERSPQQVSGILQNELARAASQSSPDRAAAAPAPTSADQLAASAFGVLPERQRQELQNAALRFGGSALRRRTFAARGGRRTGKSSPFGLIRCPARRVLIRFSPGWLRSATSRMMVRRF